MSSELPSISPQKALKIFKKFGWEIERKCGSHQILKKDGSTFLLTIPVHKGKDLKKGLLRSQIKTAGITVKEFLKYT